MKNNITIILILSLVLFIFIMLPKPFHELEAAYCNSDFSFKNFRPFGCSPLGEDLLSLTFFGAFQTLLTASGGRFLASFLALIGFALAHLGGKAAFGFISRLSEAFMTIPALMLALSFGFFMGAGYVSMILAIGISEWSFSQKWLLGRMKEYNRFNFIEASIAAGGTKSHLLKVHFAPFLIKDIVFLFFIYFPTSLLSTAALEFLGLSTGDKIPGLGYQAAAYKDLIMLYPNVTLPSMAALILIVSLSIVLKKKFET
ncbi:MAG: ABC transporter permease subunit [Spirochaetia bacterium]|nr:ABC transporter permease subunit [Spirochaetia bacterium]